MSIETDDLKRMLPEPDSEYATDEYYVTLARYIEKLWDGMKVFPELEAAQRKRAVLDMVAYFQDVVSDAGIWRSFVGMCRHLYRRPVPFYEEPEDYVDSELNLIDVQFIIWYSLEGSLGFQGLVSPFDSDLLRLAHQVHKLFDFLYEEAPAADDFKLLQELDLDDQEQVRDIFRTSGWLFWNSYFLRPISKHAYEPDVAEADELSVEETLTDANRLHITFEQPTGPLALFVREWLRLIVDNRRPTEPRQKPVSDHKYYRALRKATGDVITFFRTYGELDAFLSESFRWGDSPEGGHLSELREMRDFVVYADRRKGLIVAPGIARYVAHPANPCYEKEDAADYGYRIVMEPAACPVDLARYLFTEGLVPDAKYPTGSDSRILQDNWDFIARLYLGKYYRAD